MRRPTLGIAIACALFAVAVALCWLAYMRRPPLAVRLLPESATVMYADIAPVRAATHFDQKLELEHSAGYDQFASETGIDGKRDLDEIALAAYGAEPDRRYSEIFRGRFDHARLNAWLTRNSESREEYRGVTVFTVRHEGRPVRVAVLNSGTIAVSNTEQSDSIHAMLDSAQAFSPRGGALVRENFAEVPGGSLVWVIAHFAGGEAPSITLGDGNTIATPLPPDTTVIASARYLGAVVLRAVAVTPSAEAADLMFGRMQSVLTVARTIASGVKNGSDLAQLMKSMTLNREGRKVELKATVPEELLRVLVQQTQNASDSPSHESRQQPARP